jgi:hypothetical protein
MHHNYIAKTITYNFKAVLTLEYNKAKTQYAKAICVSNPNSYLKEHPAKPNSSTGATGYIGGDVLYAITNAHPDLEITAMVRTLSARTQAYPKH